MFTKEKEIVLKLLELYKDMPNLWDKKHNNYPNKKCRYEAHLVLLEVYKELEPNATVKTLYKKLQNLRTNYTKEIKKVLDSNRTRVAYVPSLYYYKALQFLGTTTISSRRRSETRSMDPLKAEDFSPPSDAETGSQKSVLSNLSQRNKARITQASLLEKQDRLMTTAGGLLHCKEKEEDWEILGKSIGLQLRDLDQYKLAIAQKIISDAIYYAKIDLLTHNSFINLGAPVTLNSPNASPSH